MDGVAFRDVSAFWTAAYAPGCSRAIRSQGISRGFPVSRACAELAIRDHVRDVFIEGQHSKQGTRESFA
jgi:hypothetical protein